MKAKALFLFACVLFARNSFAAEAETSRTGAFDKSPDDILDVLTDYENTCDSGCRYSLPGLKETKVQSTDDSKSVVWQKIVNIQTVTQFVASNTSRRDDGTIVLSSNYPTATELAALKASTGLSHETAFSSMVVVWTMRPTSTGQTQVSVQMKVQHNLPAVLNGMLRQSMDRSLAAMFENFTR
jgi:hypothetical protein